MMDILEVVSTKDAKQFKFKWPKCKEANRYVLEGMTGLFYYEPISIITNNEVVITKDIVSKYLKFRVNYFVVAPNKPSKSLKTTVPIMLRFKNDCDTALEYDNVSNLSEDIPECEKSLEPIKLRAVKSYVGGSIVFEHRQQFDRFRLHCFDKKGMDLVIETEDCIVTSPYIQEGIDYYVEALKLNQAKTGSVVVATSERWTCVFKDCTRTTDTNLVSVVVPVYNAQNFVSRTIDSILASTLKEIEVILVDDGSTDKSSEICDWYANTYSNVIVHHQANGGLPSARNSGTAKATGEFLAFVDSDDVIHPCMYANLYKATVKFGTDIAIAQTIVNDDYDVKTQVFIPEFTKLTDDCLVLNYNEMLANRNQLNNLYFVAVWNKIIRRNLATKIAMPNIPFYEDVGYTFSVYTYIPKFVLVLDSIYYWDKRKRQTEGTISTIDHGNPAEISWRDYIMAVTTSLREGNIEDEIVLATYKYDVLLQMLDVYSKFQTVCIEQIVVAAMVVYFVNKYSLSISTLIVRDKAIYDIWCKLIIEYYRLGLSEYDGEGTIPEIFYEKLKRIAQD